MIGARFSLYPMTDRFVPVIVGAVEKLDETPLRRETDDISTFVSGEENALFDALSNTFARAWDGIGDDHLVMSLTLSRGCPGEPGEDVCDPAAARGERFEPLDDQGDERDVACQFSLYPMGTAGYMDAIYSEIDLGSEGVRVTPQHLCTRIEGSLSAVFGQLRTAFDRVAELTPHVVIHATLSVNSPTTGS